MPRQQMFVSAVGNASVIWQVLALIVSFLPGFPTNTCLSVWDTPLPDAKSPFVEMASAVI